MSLCVWTTGGSVVPCGVSCVGSVCMSCPPLRVTYDMCGVCRDSGSFSDLCGVSVISVVRRSVTLSCVSVCR